MACTGETKEPKRLVAEMYTRDVSMRDPEAAFTKCRGRYVFSRWAVGGAYEAL